MNKAYNDFVQGQKDCRDGNDQPDNPGEWYLRGYAVQYELEQMITHRRLNSGPERPKQTADH